MITAQDLQVTFGRGTPLERTALSGITLSIPERQFVTVIGSNGSGKSTLLGVLAGDLQVDRGTIHIGDEDVTQWPAADRAARVARVFQDPTAGSCPTLTIEENLALAEARGRHRGLRRALDRKLREKLRSRVADLGLGLENRLSDPMGLLSGGQRQAVSLLMASLASSKILLLDEHTAALDPRMAEFVLDITRRIVVEHHLTSLMVTHSMRQALDLGDRTIMLHEGRIVHDISGQERAEIDVPGLLALFSRHRDGGKPNDAGLLSD